MAGIRKPQFDFSEKKTTTGKPKCYLCSRNHPLKYCRAFKELSPTTRRMTIINKRYCVNCLAFDHVRYWCTSRHRCQFEYTPGKFCNARHHTLLHRDASGDPSSSFEDYANDVPFNLCDNSESDGDGQDDRPLTMQGFFGDQFVPPVQGDGLRYCGCDSDDSDPAQCGPLLSRFSPE